LVNNEGEIFEKKEEKDYSIKRFIMIVLLLNELLLGLILLKDFWYDLRDSPYFFSGVYKILCK